MSANKGQQKSTGVFDPPSSIVGIANTLRETLRAVEVETRRMTAHNVFKSKQMYRNQHGEMKDQIMLAVRHLEDARMRLGKVCQYAGDGMSIYDKA